MDFSDKRTNFRFPAYGDDAGVKLNRNKKTQEFLADLDNEFPYGSNRRNQVKNANEVVLDPVEVLDQSATPRDGVMNMHVEHASPRRQVVHHSSALSKRFDKSVPAIYKKNRGQGNPSGMSKSERASEKKAYTAEGDQTKQTEGNVYVEPSKQSYQAPQSSFSNKLYDIGQNGQAKYQKKGPKSAAFRSSYHLPGETENKVFAPKHIPASMIDESSTKTQKENSENQKVMESLRELSQENLFMLDTDSIPEMDAPEIIED